MDSYRETRASHRREWCGFWILLFAALAAFSGCKTIAPVAASSPLTSRFDVPQQLPAGAGISSKPIWEPSMAVVPTANVEGNEVTIHNIRNCSYVTESDYVVNHYDKTFRLDELETVDFIMVPFKNAPSLAHTMLSFGFRDDSQVVISAEVRLEKGDSYSPLRGALGHYQLMYLIGDERDLILLRTQHRDVDVYVYRARTTREQARKLFQDMLLRANELAAVPERYDTITNNCTTNIARHINRLAPGRVPYSFHVLLPGYSDRLAYDLGLLDTDLPFAEARRQARINDLAQQYARAPDFSARIRQRILR